MKAPLVALVARQAKEKAELRREVRRLRTENAVLHEITDVWQQRCREAEAALRDLERLHGWLGSEAT